MFVKPIVSDGGLQRQMNVGDILSQVEPPVPATDTTNTTLAITPAMLLNSTIYVRNPAGVSTDTFPTADALISAMMAGSGSVGIPAGFSFRWKLVNLSANVITGAVTANTGATLVRGTVAAGAAGSAAGTKEFLVQITNGTPLVTAVGISSVTGTAVLSGFTQDQLNRISVGQVVTNAIVGLQGTTVIAVNQTAGTVTMSGNTNSTASNNTITFSPTYTITGLSL